MVRPARLPVHSRAMTVQAASAASSTSRDAIRRLTGGGPRRIAESAGLVITHGEGAYLVDDEGKKYLDFATAMGVAAIGHGNKHWADAVATQAGKLAACVLHTHEHAEYLNKLEAYVPAGLERVALYSGGAEAVEVAVRLAQSVSGQRHVLSFTNGFHGKTAGVRFTGHRHAEERSSLGLEWVHDVPYPTCVDHDCVTYSACDADGEGSIKALEAYAAHLDGVAAVIVEPVLGTAGNRPPERRFLRSLRDLCDKRGWLLIMDESITGFGRLGHNFAAGYFDVTPDILILGKAIGGGFPLSGVAARGRLWDGSMFAEMSATSSSYGANPLACAAGSAVIDIVSAPGFLDNVNAVSRRLSAGLIKLAADSQYVAAPRGAGMMLGFDLIDPATGELAPAEMCRTLFRSCLEQGILIVGDVPGVRLNPPLILSEVEADRALEALAAALCH